MKKLICLVTIFAACVAVKAQNIQNLTNLPSAVLSGMTTNLTSRNILITFEPRYGITFIARGCDTNTQSQAGNTTTFNFDLSVNGTDLTNFTTTTPWTFGSVFTGGVCVAVSSVIPANHTNFQNAAWLRLSSITVPTNGTFFPSNIIYRANSP